MLRVYNIELRWKITSGTNQIFEMKYLKNGTTLLIGGTMLVVVGLLISQERIDTKPHEGIVAHEPLQGKLKMLDDKMRDNKQTKTDSLEGLTTSTLYNTSEFKTSTTCLRNGSLPYCTKAKEFLVQEYKMKERLANISKKCRYYMQSQYWQNLRMKGTVWIHKPNGIYYCIIHKAGSTFWKRLLRFLGNDFPQNNSIQRPSDIDRTFVHYAGLTSILQSNARKRRTRKRMSTGKSFMFARNPYSRIWSAYIDKFFCTGLLEK